MQDTKQIWPYSLNEGIVIYTSNMIAHFLPFITYPYIVFDFKAIRQNQGLSFNLWKSLKAFGGKRLNYFQQQQKRLKNAQLFVCVSLCVNLSGLRSLISKERNASKEYFYIILFVWAQVVVVKRAVSLPTTLMMQVRTNSGKKLLYAGIWPITSVTKTFLSYVIGQISAKSRTLT